MADKKELRPPYATSGVADQILDLFGRIVPKKIDTKFITDNNIATAPNAFKAVDLVKWLGITDAEGNVREDVSSKLRLVGKDRDDYIKELVKKSYKHLLEHVTLETARKDDIVNYFVSNYKFGSSQAKYAASLFLHLCHRFQISVSDELKKKTHTGSGVIKKRKKKEAKKVSTKNFSDEEIPPTINQEGKVILSIVGNGLNRKLEAHTKGELEELYHGKFKSLVEAAKLLFLSEDTEPHNHVTKSNDEVEPD